MVFLGWLLMRDRGVPPGLGPQPEGEERPEPPPEPEEGLEMAPASFDELPGWDEDSVAEALPALLASCDSLDLKPGQSTLGYAGTAADWHSVCRRARALPPGDDTAARSFFEESFRPWSATDLGEPEGLFTGYYEPTLHGSRRRGGEYQVPLYARPPELVAVDLGEFRQDLAGRRIAGRVVDGRLVPMPDRTEIDDEGALSGRGLEVVWVDDPVDAFFLHIQGSGLVRMDDGSELRVGYAGQNGHPYRAIGRDLVDRGHMELEEVSMQSIRRFLAENPDQAREIMALNPSYVFFRRLGGGAPLGAQGVELTPRRSLAVDRKYHPLGVPVWLDASAPSLAAAGAEDGAEAGAEAAAEATGGDSGGDGTPAEPSADEPGETGTATGATPAAGAEPLRRLLIAQDTGGAIRGPVRGDVFWGPGDEAAEISGRMRHAGRMWVLLPAGVDPRDEVQAAADARKEIGDDGEDEA